VSGASWSIVLPSGSKWNGASRCVPLCSDSVSVFTAAPRSAWPNCGVTCGGSYMNHIGRSGPSVGETSWTVSPAISRATAPATSWLVGLSMPAIMAHGA
jgi:hypothetical protein